MDIVLTEVSPTDAQVGNVYIINADVAQRVIDTNNIADEQAFIVMDVYLDDEADDIKARNVNLRGECFTVKVFGNTLSFSNVYRCIYELDPAADVIWLIEKV